jgi:hypothetical protein
MKIELKGWFSILDKKGNVIWKSENTVLENGYRLICSYLRNEMVADGYGGATLRPAYIHFGTGTKDVEVTDWHLDGMTTALGANAPITSTTLVAFNHVRFEAASTLPGGLTFTIAELGLGLTLNDPASSVDYPNTVIARARVDPAFTGVAIPLRYDLQFLV